MSAPTATGKLATTPFCELLIYALSQELSGSLVLECPDRTKHALLFAAGTNIFAYWNSDRMVLSMHGATEVDERAAPDLFRIVGELAGRADMMAEHLFW